VGIKLA